LRKDEEERGEKEKKLRDGGVTDMAVEREGLQTKFVQGCQVPCDITGGI